MSTNNKKSRNTVNKGYHHDPLIEYFQKRYLDEIYYLIDAESTHCNILELLSKDNSKKLGISYKPIIHSLLNSIKKLKRELEIKEDIGRLTKQFDNEGELEIHSVLNAYLQELHKYIDLIAFDKNNSYDISFLKEYWIYKKINILREAKENNNIEAILDLVLDNQLLLLNNFGNKAIRLITSSANFYKTHREKIPIKDLDELTQRHGQYFLPLETTIKCIKKISNCLLSLIKKPPYRTLELPPPHVLKRMVEEEVAKIKEVVNLSFEDALKSYPQMSEDDFKEMKTSPQMKAYDFVGKRYGVGGSAVRERCRKKPKKEIAKKV